MPSITFFYEDIGFRLRSSPLTRAWIRKVIKAENKRLGELNYIFCSDEFLLGINRQYLEHDTLTDIITFDNSEEPDRIEGDIFISIDRVTENANKFNTSFPKELHRVMIHGALHLIGYNDKTPSQKKQMRKKEDSYLSLHRFLLISCFTWNKIVEMWKNFVGKFLFHVELILTICLKNTM